MLGASRQMKRSERNRSALAIALACGLLVLASGFASAQSYPSKPIRLVIPIAPGGGNDTLGRYIGKQLGEALGQPLVPENRAGGGGVIGGEYVARSAPDGYTLMFGGAGQIVSSLTHGGKPDVQKDFTAISIVGEYASLLAVHPSLQVRTAGDLIRLAKARPGELAYGSAGTGSAGHLVMEMFRSAAGIRLVHVPYKGAGPALADVMSGQVQIIFSNPAGTLSTVKAGRLRPLGLSGSHRLAALPEVPTIAESGLAGFNATYVLGLMGPAGMPRDIVARLAAECVRAVQRPDTQAWFAQQGMDPVGSTPEAFAARIRSDTERYGKVIRESGMRLE
jgi:tripartite-type tricarboxylate transporter receptor subunit TctC